MRIDTATSYPYAGHQAGTSAVARPDSASFSVAPAKVPESSEAGAVGVKRPDFTNMTRQEMRDWVNSEIRGGRMSLDEGAPFMAMTMKIPVGATGGGEIPAITDPERIDFVQRARAGIEGAKFNNDRSTLAMLQSAMRIMQRVQGQAVGVDVRV